MTKTDFAELKEKLCIKPEISFDVPDDMYVLSIKTMKDLTGSVVEHQHTKSSAIISELIEIIKLQSECMNGYSLEKAKLALDKIKNITAYAGNPTKEMTEYLIKQAGIKCPEIATGALSEIGEG